MICCYQITKIVSTRYGSAIASYAWGFCNFCPLADLAISVFREMSINTVLTQILTSLECGLQKHFMRRTGVRVSMFKNFIIHQIFFEFLQPVSPFFQQRVSPFFLWLFFSLVLEFYWLGQHRVSPIVTFNSTMLNNDSPVLKVSLKLTDQILKTKLDDKPGTTIGTKFSVLHCIRIPF